MNVGNIILGIGIAIWGAALLAVDEIGTKGLTNTISTGVSLNQQIASSSLNNSVTAGANGGQFVITKSGRYFLSTDVIANPVVSGPIIYINCSDVVLDLGGKTLTISGTTSFKKCIGVKIAPGMNNIAICNGTISGSSLPTSSPRLRMGISLPGTALNVSSNFVIYNVDIIGCGFTGIDIEYCNSIDIDETTVHKTKGCLCFDENKYGLYMNNCTDAVVNNSSFSYTEVTYADAALGAYGVYLTNCNNVCFKAVSASNNRGSGLTTSAAGVGIYLNATTSSVFDTVRCVANKIIGGSVCQQATTSPAAGIWLDGGSLGNIFTDCVANDNAALDLSQTCSAYGFRMTNSSGQNSFVRCVASNNTGVAAEGFSSSSGSGKNTYKYCVANGNTGGAASSYVTAAGFRAEFSQGNSYLKCEASGNAVGVVSCASPDQSAHGVVLRSDFSSVIRESIFSANGFPGVGAAYGIRLAGTCRLCMVGFNEMISNTGLQQYGYKDDSADTTTLLRGNMSFGHGACYGGGTSYLLNGPQANYSFVFSEAAGAMNVQNMIKEADIANMNAFEAGTSSWFNFSVLANAISG